MPGIVTPDRSMQRRVNDLERRVEELSALVMQLSRPGKHVTPLNARLWRCSLNENMGSNTAGADLLTLGGTDTSLDVTVNDPIDLVESAENGDALYCLEQIDLDGTRYFIAFGAPKENVKTFCRFTLDSALATTDASKDATITAQYGPGKDHATTDITIYNVAASSNYIFEGDSGDAGIGFWDHDGDKWWIVQLECPA